jgi:acetyltransferase-like isoleucine patch superfamily enzyme
MTETSEPLTSGSRGNAEFIRGFFKFLQDEGIRAAVLHGWEKGFDGELSDVDYVIEKKEFSKVARIVVSSGVEFGEDVVIGHQVTIGNRSGIMAAPKIGHRVYIGAGAKILGPVRIGDDAVIGANAVVTKDVPAKAKVVGANRILH